MPVEEIAAQYGIAGAALVLMYLMYKANLETTGKLSNAIDRLTESFRDLREEIRLMRSELDTINQKEMYMSRRRDS